MRAIRFRPPPLKPSPDLAWVLARAFGRPEIPRIAPPDPAAALDLASRLDLAGRVASRASEEELEADLGPVARGFARARHASAASALRYEQTLEQIVARASEPGIPLLVLKGGALSLLGISGPGARGFADLDVLVPFERVGELTALLVADGWQQASLPPSEHQEPPLYHPLLGTVEIHRCLPGVRAPGSSRFLDASAAFDPALSQPLPGLGGLVRAPSSAVLAAHALAHGLVQHGLAPDSYPLFRLLADLQDLEASGVTLRDALRFLAEVDEGDLQAARVLLEALSAGAALDLPEGPARDLLAHFVAGSLDPGYSVALKSDPRYLMGLSDAPIPVLALKRLWNLVFLSRERVDAIYGRQSHPWGHLARQVFRPVDLAIRLIVSIRSRIRFAGARHAHGE